MEFEDRVVMVVVVVPVPNHGLLEKSLSFPPRRRVGRRRGDDGQHCQGSSEVPRAGSLQTSGESAWIPPELRHKCKDDSICSHRLV